MLALTALAGAGVLITWLATRGSATTPPAKTIVLTRVTTSAAPRGDATVPDVVGKKLPDAVATVRAAGFRLSYMSYPVKITSRAGTIVRQTPHAGRRARRNAQVIVYLAVKRR